MSELGDHYWQGCTDGVILYQQCASCHRPLTYPRPFCHRCGAKDPVWKKSSGRGKVVGATTVHRAPTEEFARLAPYRLLLIDLAEASRIMAHGDIDLAVTDPVQIDFLRV